MRIILLLLLGFGVSGCGQYGELYYADGLPETSVKITQPTEKKQESSSCGVSASR